MIAKRIFFSLLLGMNIGIYADTRIDDEDRAIDGIQPLPQTTVHESRPTLKWNALPGVKYYSVSWTEINPESMAAIKSRHNIIVSQASYQFEEEVKANCIYQWDVSVSNIRNIPTNTGFGMFLTGNMTKEKVKAYADALAQKVIAIEQKLGMRIHNSSFPFIYGVMIDKMADACPARKMGLRVSDIIFECNGKRIDTVNDFFELVNSGIAIKELKIQRVTRHMIEQRTVEELYPKL